MQLVSITHSKLHSKTKSLFAKEGLLCLLVSHSAPHWATQMLHTAINFAPVAIITVDVCHAPLDQETLLGVGVEGAEGSNFFNTFIHNKLQKKTKLLFAK